MTGENREKLLNVHINVQQIEKDSPLYPPLLREIFDPPQILYCRGQLPNPEKPAVAIVGTRHPSAAASMQALALGRDFARAGITVISGLALGIDSLAHRGTLEGSGFTAAVLGSSVDQVYPASNRDLARRIIKAGGCLLSEYELGTSPRKQYYPQRNRIISGLARATIIVEAPAASGALYTARFALEQGRDVYVASSGAASPIGEGTKKLVLDGCPVIKTAADILTEWGINTLSANEPKARNENSGAFMAAELKQKLGL